MSDWVPADSVPEILEAMANLGATTVPPESGPVRTSSSPPRLDPLQKRLLGLVATVLGFVLFLVTMVVVFDGEEEEVQPVVELAPTPEAIPEPTTPPPPPRIDAVSRRPANWANRPVSDPRRRSGSAQASSELREGGGKVHGARNITDFRSSTAWCEGNPDSDGDGEWVQLAVSCVEKDFREIVGMEVVSGFTDKPADWAQNNRLSQAQVKVTVDGRVVLLADAFLADRPGYQFLEFPRPFLCQEGETVRVRLQIEQLYPGDAYSDACVSGLALYERNR